jgi:hypothetical protein
MFNHIKNSEMKKTIITAMLFGALMTGKYSYANAHVFSDKENLNKITSITFQDVHDGATLYLKNSKGRTMFTRKLNKSGTITQSFDLSELPEADYFFELETKGSISVYPVYVGKEKVILLEDKNYTLVKPEIRQRGDKVVITWDADTRQNLKIDIWFEGEELAFTERIRAHEKTERIYDFSTSISGDYLFNIYADNRTFSEFVNIQTENK